MAKKIQTLCLVHNHPRILLGMKKRGFGAGRWNGFGGKVERGETVYDAAKRELREEAGITAYDIQPRGVLDFRWKGKSEVLEVHIFRAADFEGKPTESNEMKPCWFHVDEIPFDEMWSDDRYWMPLFLAGKSFRGEFLFGESDAVINHRLSVIDQIRMSKA